MLITILTRIPRSNSLTLIADKSEPLDDFSAQPESLITSLV